MVNWIKKASTIWSNINCVFPSKCAKINSNKGIAV